MLLAGHHYKLRVNRASEYGLYLANEEGDEVLLPNRFVLPEFGLDDELDVFVYFDSEDRIVASTERPLAQVGEVASLKVVDKTIHGAFLDWGIPAKDLFLPNSNIQGRVEIGKERVVYLYNDNVTGRVVATMNLKSFINNTQLTIQPREKVEILIASESPIGYRVVINNRHWGMLYRNQIFRPVFIGDRMEAYVSRITEDLRVDVSIQQQGYDEIRRAADFILELIQQAGGTLPLNDNSSPDEIYRATQMSKKVFKRSLGYLMKHGIITMGENSISLR